MTQETCPDILLLATGQYIVIGTDVTPQYADDLPADTGCADHERIVMIPPETLHSAAQGLPSTSGCSCDRVVVS